MRLALWAIALSIAIGGCKVADPPPITAPWHDDFERADLGGDYFRSGGNYKIVDGDIKVELYADGRSYAHNKGAYTSTGYDLIMGGWHNSKSMIARGDEHGGDVVERRTPKVVPGRHYHWKIVRQGARLDWYVDDLQVPFLSYQDQSPLEGPGHQYFGFSNWESDVWFDNLAISPL